MNKHKPCAACKFKRRKCGQDCPMAPYFPAHMLQHYKNAHKVVRHSHLNRLLHSLPPHKRSTAMKHIIAEAGIRVADPVGGSYGLSRNLRLMIAEEEEKLRRLRNALSVFRVEGGGGGAVVSLPLVLKEGCVVPGGFLHSLILQEHGNTMFVWWDQVVPEHDEVVLEHDVNPVQGEEK